MTDRELEQKLAKALEHAAPDDLDGVLSRCQTERGVVIDMKTGKNKKRWVGALIAACLALALVGGGGGVYYHQAHAVASVVSLDVNPSIELKVNKAEKVLSCTAMNEDAAAVLADMGGGADLEGTKLDVAVNAIVGALLRGGYLDDISSAILISVEDKDADRGARLQQELAATVDGVLQNAASQAAVYSQYNTVDAGVEAQAQANSISTGKAALVNQVIALNGSLKFEELAQLSVEELRDLTRIGAPGMPIGKDAAAWAAQEYAGTLILSSVVVQDVDPELDDPAPHYEVELAVNGREYEYRVDAFTGEVLSGVRDVLSVSAPGSSPAASGEPAGNGDQMLAAVEAYFTGKYTQLSWSDVRVTGLKSDRENGAFVWDVELWCAGYEFEYELDDATARILREETDYRAPGAGQAPTPAVMDIGLDQAQIVAMGDTGFAAVSSARFNWLKTEREYDDGRLVYELEFTVSYSADGYNKYEYTIDAATGDILKREMETVSTPAPQTTPTPAQVPAASDDIGADAAKAAALGHAGLTESQVTGLKLEREMDWDDDYRSGRLEYEVQFRSGGFEYEYKIDGTTGSVIKYETEPVQGGQPAQSGTGSQIADIGADAAKAAALGHAGLTESQVTGLKLEREMDWDDDYRSGRLEYEVEFRSGGYEYEYTIDGSTGAVLDHERDWDD